MVPAYDSFVEGLEAEDRRRLLEAVALVSAAVSEEGSNLLRNTPEYLRSLIQQGAPIVLREMGYTLTAEVPNPNHFPPELAQVERRLVDRLRVEAPTMEKEPRTGVPRGLREYLARRPDQKAAWEKLNGPIPGVPDRFLRMLDDDDIL